MGFSDFLGNATAVAALRGALRAERVPHAMLFTGPRGVGKFTLAHMFAQAANCERLKDDFCGGCSPCQRIAQLANLPDLIILDLRLTDISGITVLRELKADPDTSSVPVIAYTASVGDADKVTKLIASEPAVHGDTRVLQKPFAIDELLSIVA